jgi:hypothetical protein
MKTLTAQDGPRKDANPSLNPIEASIKPFQDFTDEDASQGSEFLDDAIRMHDQALESVAVNERV